LAADAALAVEAVIGEHVEELLEQVAAVASLAIAGSPVAAEARHFLQDRLALPGHGIAGLHGAFELLHLLAAVEHAPGDLLALGVQPATRLGVVVATLANIGALGPLHLALRLPQL